MKLFLLTILVLLLGNQFTLAAENQSELSQKAFAVLKTHCYRCHGVKQLVKGLDVLNHKSLTANNGGEEFEAYYVVPGKPDQSGLWQSVDPENAYMPKEGSAEAASITNAERLILKEWIKQGAVFPKRRMREFISTKTILSAMRDYLFESKADDRKFLRFFTFTHLYNNNEKVTEYDLRLYKAALSKVANSLSYQRSMHLPQAVPGSEGTVFVVDLRRLGWDQRNIWLEVLKQYPYGLKYDYVRDEQTQQIAKDLALLSESSLPFVRADWFVFMASQPPLYHTILDLPETIQELEQRLEVDFHKNYQNGWKAGGLGRAGFGRSGVSRQNRLVERHKTGAGAYWISYDFKPRRARGDLVRFPLGPEFEGNKFNRHSFLHDGGEVIFNLPNGLQAYMLADGQGNRLDIPAPADIVFDSAAVSGTPAIINGLSCMSCHRNGMISNLKDEIRGANAVGGTILDKVKALYPPSDVMDRWLEQDSRRFQTALQEATGPFLQVEEDAKKPITEFPEPVGKVAGQYLADLAPLEIALELGIENVEILQAKIEANRELLKLGLGTLTQQPAGTIKREKWETLDGTSLYQDVAVELRIGTAVQH
jgi:serine/threonine-protein kinase